MEPRTKARQVLDDITATGQLGARRKVNVRNPMASGQFTLPDGTKVVVQVIVLAPR